VANEFQISSLTELFDNFGDSTLYKLPTAIKPDARDEITTVEQQSQSNFLQNSNLRWCNKYDIGSV